LHEQRLALLVVISVYLLCNILKNDCVDGILTRMNPLSNMNNKEALLTRVEALVGRAYYTAMIEGGGGFSSQMQ